MFSIQSKRVVSGWDFAFTCVFLCFVQEVVRGLFPSWTVFTLYDHILFIDPNDN